MIKADLIGELELQRMLDRLVKHAPKKVVSTALRKSAKRTKPRLLALISGIVLNVGTGQYLSAWARAKIKSAGRLKGGQVRVGIEWPTRSEFGIAPDDPFFYPAALEYGAPGNNQPAKPHMRRAIDDFKRGEIAAIARDIKNGIEKEAMKK